MAQDWKVVGKGGKPVKPGQQQAPRGNCSNYKELTLDWVLCLIKNNEFTSEHAGMLLDNSEDIAPQPGGRGTGHARGHVLSNPNASNPFEAITNLGAYEDARGRNYLDRLRHSVYCTKADQNNAVWSVLKEFLSLLINNKSRIGWPDQPRRVVLFAPAKDLNIDIWMIEITQELSSCIKSCAFDKFWKLVGEQQVKPEFITLVIDLADDHRLHLQTVFPVAQYPQNFEDNLMKGSCVIEVNNNYYLLTGDKKNFINWPIIPGGMRSYDKFSSSNALDTDNYNSQFSKLFPSSSFNYHAAFGVEKIILNGMKVISDQPIPVFPVTLQTKESKEGVK